MRYSKYSFLPLVLLLLLLCFPSDTNAIVIGFENLPTATPGDGGYALTQPTLSGGYSFTSTAGTLLSMGANASMVIADNGTTSLVLNSNTPSVIVMTQGANKAFDFLSFEAGEMFTLDLDANALSIEVTGVVNGGGTAVASFDLDLIRDGAGGVDDFEEFVLPGSFTNLLSVSFSGVGVGGQNDFQIDNLNVELSSSTTNNSAIPEPSTGLLLMLGVLFIRTQIRYQKLPAFFRS